MLVAKTTLVRMGLCACGHNMQKACEWGSATQPQRHPLLSHFPSHHPSPYPHPLMQIERAARPALFAETSLGDYVDNHRCRLASEGEMVPTPKEYVSTLQVRFLSFFGWWWWGEMCGGEGRGMSSLWGGGMCGGGERDE